MSSNVLLHFIHRYCTCDVEIEAILAQADVEGKEKVISIFRIYRKHSWVERRTTTYAGFSALQCFVFQPCTLMCTGEK